MARRVLPYLLMFFFNFLILFIFPNSNRIIIPVDILALIFICYFLSSKLENIFNKILSISWMIFFFLGLLNINSILLRTNIWKLKIHDASLLYFLCLLVFISSLLFFENSKKKKILINSKLSGYDMTINGWFKWFLICFSLILTIDVYLKVGFFPILIGESFVDEMYNYNYGYIYGYKFFLVYTFIVVVYSYQFKKKILITSALILFLLFALSIDGKRFLLLVSLISMIPILIINSRLEMNDIAIKRMNYTPILIGVVAIGLYYVLINILRTGGNIKESLFSMIENIPFGVEFKDYVHSYNTYTPQKIKGYNYELSAIGSLLNSYVLEIFGQNKEALYQLGSHKAWMTLYHEEFGIRIGIIGELYFAYGLFVLPLMILLAFFTNRINFNILKAKTYFSRITYSILFGLMIFIINGQSTVFFGCLTLIFYAYIIHKLFFILYKKTKFN